MNCTALTSASALGTGLMHRFESRSDLKPCWMPTHDSAAAPGIKCPPRKEWNGMDRSPAWRCRGAGGQQSS